MGKPILPRSGGKTDRSGNPTFSTQSIWISLLVFSAVAFFNLVYVTRTVLVFEDESPRQSWEASWSIGFNNATGNTSLGTISSRDGDGPEDDPKRVVDMDTAERHQEQENNGSGAKGGGDENHAVKTQSDQNELSGNKTDTGVTNHAAAATGATNEIQYTPRHKPKNRDNNKTPAESKKSSENRTLSPEEMLKYTFEESAMMPNVSNAIYYKDIPHEFLVEDPSVFLWDRSDARIPEWMKDYFRWHRWKRSTWKNRKPPTTVGIINNNNKTAADDWWKSERWLISQCLMSQDKKKCGGTADRLKPIPVLLRIAYENKRIFLIRWTRPAALEEFLLPPTGGFDWRVPPDLAEVIEDGGGKAGKRLNVKKAILRYASGGMPLIRTRYQTSIPGAVYEEMVLNNNTNSKSGAEDDDKSKYGFEDVFSRVWRILFTPSPPIQTILRSRLSKLGLVPNEYVSSHLRALYAVDTRPTDEIHRYTENALACATLIFPGVPIFFASDATVALEHARDFNGRVVVDGSTMYNVSTHKGQSIKLRVVTASVGATTTPTLGDSTETNSSTATALSQPWHLDSFLGPTENFYDTFVDLYLLAMAGCVTYNKGGYGHWGMLIGGHPHCQVRQALVGNRLKRNELCTFRATSETEETITTAFHKNHPSVFGKDDAETGPLFLPPMD